ncbi:MAG: hypothetical protein V4510_03680 [bacterium]
MKTIFAVGVVLLMGLTVAPLGKADPDPCQAIGQQCDQLPTNLCPGVGNYPSCAFGLACAHGVDGCLPHVPPIPTYKTGDVSTSAGTRQWCSGPDATHNDVWCHKAFPKHDIVEYGMYYSANTWGTNHASYTDQYTGDWWYLQFKGNGIVDETCSESGGDGEWVASDVFGGLSEDTSAPNCDRLPWGAWGAYVEYA